jgi:hypothetical protein
VTPRGMTIQGNPDIEIEAIRMTIEKRAAKARGGGLAWALFLIVGAPLGLMAALGPLSFAGVYLEFLRPLWRPWPPDPWKPIIGLAGFAATLAYVAFRRGLFSGFRRGTVAAMAAVRNLLEGRRRPGLEEPIPPPPPIEEPSPDRVGATPPPPDQMESGEVVAR